MYIYGSVLVLAVLKFENHRFSRIRKNSNLRTIGSMNGSGSVPEPRFRIGFGSVLGSRVVFCIRKLKVLRNNFTLIYQQQFCASENAASARSCSSSVCENASQKSFTVSYLISSCGLSPNDAVSASKKLCFKSPENPDAVLKLLREYGFTNAHHIPKLVSKFPGVLSASPSKTLLPKLEFLRSIGVPIPVLAQKLSAYPLVFRYSLKNSIIPSYNDLKSLLGSDERVVHVFVRCPMTFVSFDISIFTERDQAVAMGCDTSNGAFVHAVRVLASMKESTLKHKMEVYRRYGYTEFDINVSFLRYPFCMTISEKKITANLDFLVNTLGYKPAAIAQHPTLVSLSLEKRLKLRCLVARALNEKGLKVMANMTTMLKLSEEKFLNQYIFKYEKDIPNLLDIYRGKSNPGP
ncbi:hypothetical protein CASFOL_009974 [Castilleja foliolosa]|uniref:Uncharacterized protein n=1 Tax=Castilleja foliolosa TaxID=1961234 RepID=A0ABD3DUX3_9LAMI